MRVIIVALLVSFVFLSAPAFAQTATQDKLPTRQLCQAGWKPGVQWTEAQFKQECAKILTNAKPSAIKK